MTDLVDVLRTVVRHPMVALLMFLNIMVITAAYLALQTPVYQSTDTLQLSATAADSNFLTQINSLTPLYSALLSSPQTLAVAQTNIGQTQLAQITVVTFPDSPVIKVNATSGSGPAAELSASEVVLGLNQRLTGSQLGAPGITIGIIDGPSSAVITWPRPALTFGAAAFLGILLSTLAAWITERVQRRRRARKAAATAATAARAATPTAERVGRLHHAPGRLDYPRVTKAVGGRDANKGRRDGGPATFSIEGIDDKDGDAQRGAAPRPNLVPPSGETGDVTIG
ncbi:MAG: hypothetical protein DLM65_10150 [Candidatus Aeolococcus gillhamiae]|uniref:Polysaccharide chain length determinant N-terminal domain-containing protein n=1 Tax=Candidatus Aeolococcus gillhamiae TaxID=3127015 RepID=A0A2W5Z9T7_9BACT|nr:MAG: hypothetical protein DLM65_10150 [Candidatus Dormibacter sp. RRmetagenome_bin12]